MTVSITLYHPADAPSLHDVFYIAVHQGAAAYYDAEQRKAWAPQDIDRAAWQQKMDALQPLIARQGGQVVGYADLQTDGTIDHFFVSTPRLGVGRTLMQALLSKAKTTGITTVHARVSLAAEAFFLNQGFVVTQRHQVILRGVMLCNASMEKHVL